jgi:hypothetical protein
MDQIVKKINSDLPVHNMWDGFWIHSFRQKTLIISCSFDRIYYRDFDLIFKSVSFFNVPVDWRDTAVEGSDLLRLASKEEFAQHHPDFEVEDRFIYAIDLHISIKGNLEKFTFFILAKHVYLIRCEPDNNRPKPEYKDIFPDEKFPCMRNRVPAK